MDKKINKKTTTIMKLLEFDGGTTIIFAVAMITYEYRIN